MRPNTRAPSMSGWALGHDIPEVDELMSSRGVSPALPTSRGPRLDCRSAR
jgi:hypothetical protein